MKTQSEYYNVPAKSFVPDPEHTYLVPLTKISGKSVEICRTIVVAF